MWGTQLEGQYNTSKTYLLRGTDASSTKMSNGADVLHDNTTEMRRILPATVTVAGFVYRIEYVADWAETDRDGLKASDEPWGRTKHREALIQIWDKIEPQQQLATLMHELMHVCEFIANVNLGERKLDRVASLLHGALVANPDILAEYCELTFAKITGALEK